LNVIILEKE